MKVFAVALAFITMGTLMAAGQGDSQSSAVARRLAAVLAEQHVDAIAAADPRATDRFVGGLIFPGVQLLVVSGQYAAPEAMRTKIAARQYKDVYLELVGSSAPDTRVFFQDLKADGLHPTADGGVDIMYEHVDKQTVFNGKPDRARFAVADAEYSRLLSLLLDQASAGATVGAHAGEPR